MGYMVIYEPFVIVLVFLDGFHPKTPKPLIFEKFKIYSPRRFFIVKLARPRGYWTMLSIEDQVFKICKQTSQIVMLRRTQVLLREVIHGPPLIVHSSMLDDECMSVAACYIQDMHYNRRRRYLTIF